jgi:hypothetical protein
MNISAKLEKERRPFGGGVSGDEPVDLWSVTIIVDGEEEAMLDVFENKKLAVEIAKRINTK